MVVCRREKFATDLGKGKVRLLRKKLVNCKEQVCIDPYDLEQVI